MRVSLGPVLYFWPREQLLSFYAEAADSNIDLVYLGETVCSKRRALRTDEWITLARDIAIGCGKEVVLSSLTMIEADSELGTVRRQARELARSGGVLLEANDYGAVQAARDAGLRFVAGHALNVYNVRGLARLARLGAVRWLPPVELSRDAVGAIVDSARRDNLAIETEVIAWGRLPLAHSTNCFTARAFNRQRDECGFRCGDFVDGLPLAPRGGEPLFQLNGSQTQSARHCNLFAESADMTRRGIDIMRISASRPDDWATIRQLTRRIPDKRVLPVVDDGLGNSYWFGNAGAAAPQHQENQP